MSDMLNPPAPPMPKEKNERPTLTLLARTFEELGDAFNVTKHISLQYPLSGELERKIRAAMEAKCERIIFGDVEFNGVQYCRNIDHPNDDYIFMIISTGQENVVARMIDFGWDITNSRVEKAGINKIPDWKFIWHYLIDILDNDVLRKLIRENFDIYPLNENINDGHWITPNRLEKLNKLIVERRKLDREARRASRRKAGK